MPVHPITANGVRCGVVELRLEQIEPMPYRLLLNCAKDNELQLRSAFAASSLLPAATAFLTFLIAVRTSVRRLMLCARSPIAWWARLRADLMLAMNLKSGKGREF